VSYLRQLPIAETDAMFAAVKSRLGFIPNLYRAEASRPDVLEAQSELFGAVMNQERGLTRQQKEYVFLVCSAANLSTYCVTAHCEIIRMLGIQGPEPEQIALDFRDTNLPMAVKALLGFVTKLNSHPTKLSQSDVDGLRKYGYTDEQILEAVLIVGLAKFANFVSFGLGTAPDFDSSAIQLPDMDSTNAVASAL
jgi:uncharacterized peroxidase-related enzyme